MALIIIILSFFLHSWGILSSPPSLFSDEVDAGYQAFVFNSCQSDYHGNRFPTHFHSFSDWRTPLHIYSIALAQKFLGPTDLSVRLPSLFFFLLSLIFFTLIIQKLFNNRFLSLLTLVIFSANPWLFHYSRTGFEASGMLFCLLGAIYFWLSYLTSRRLSHLLLVILLAVSSFYFYATAKLFVILLFFAILLIWRSQILKFSRRHLLPALIFGLLISLPLVRDTLNGHSGYRFSYINIFTEPTLESSVNLDRYRDIPLRLRDQVGQSPSLATKFFHNKVLKTASTFVRNYFSSFSTDFLFLTGDKNLRQGFASKGNFYYLDAILISFGLALAIISRSRSRFSLFMLVFLFLAPIPFALTRDVASPQSTRLILMLIPLFYFLLLGLNFLLKSTKNIFFWLIFFFLYLLSSLDFFHFYFIHYPELSARDWHYAFKQAVVDTQSADYSKIFYGSGNEPLLPFFYFYSRYLPPDCHPVANTIEFHNSFFSGRRIGDKYYFGPVEWSQLFNSSEKFDQYLFVVSHLEFIRLSEALKNQPFDYHLVNQPTKIYPDQEVFYYLTILPKTSSKVSR